MVDLVQTFFERDLDPSESSELARLLESSGDEALRFARLGEKSYLATGLPAHQWPAKGSWPLQGAPAAGHPLLTLALAALGLSGLAAWWFWPKPAPVPQALAPAPPAVVKPSLPVPVSRAVKPLAAVPGLEGRELKVEVDVPQQTLVTVRVLDSQGLEVRHLYTGFLQGGHWRFAWDGLLSSGKPAPQGGYLIQVQSDKGTQSKKVELARNP